MFGGFKIPPLPSAGAQVSQPVHAIEPESVPDIAVSGTLTSTRTQVQEIGQFIPDNDPGASDFFDDDAPERRSSSTSPQQQRVSLIPPADEFDSLIHDIPINSGNEESSLLAPDIEPPFAMAQSPPLISAPLVVNSSISQSFSSAPPIIAPPMSAPPVSVPVITPPQASTPFPPPSVPPTAPSVPPSQPLPVFTAPVPVPTAAAPASMPNLSLIDAPLMSSGYGSYPASIPPGSDEPLPELPDVDQLLAQPLTARSKSWLLRWLKSTSDVDGDTGVYLRVIQYFIQGGTLLSSKPRKSADLSALLAYLREQPVHSAPVPPAASAEQWNRLTQLLMDGSFAEACEAASQSGCHATALVMGAALGPDQFKAASASLVQALGAQPAGLYCALSTDCVAAWMPSPQLWTTYLLILAAMPGSKATEVALASLADALHMSGRLVACAAVRLLGGLDVSGELVGTSQPVFTAPREAIALTLLAEYVSGAFNAAITDRASILGDQFADARPTSASHTRQSSAEGRGQQLFSNIVSRIASLVGPEPATSSPTASPAPGYDTPRPAPHSRLSAPPPVSQSLMAAPPETAPAPQSITRAQSPPEQQIPQDSPRPEAPVATPPRPTKEATQKRGLFGFLRRSPQAETDTGKPRGRYFNEELRRWVIPGEEEQIRAEMSAPPPVTATTASSGPVTVSRLSGLSRYVVEDEDTHTTTQAPTTSALPSLSAPLLPQVGPCATPFGQIYVQWQNGHTSLPQLSLTMRPLIVPAEENRRRLWMGNYSPFMTEAVVRQILPKADFISLRQVVGRDGQLASYAFLEFDSSEKAEHCLQQYRAQVVTIGDLAPPEYVGRQLRMKLNYAATREQNESRTHQENQRERGKWHPRSQPPSLPGDSSSDRHYHSPIYDTTLSQDSSVVVATNTRDAGTENTTQAVRRECYINSGFGLAHQSQPQSYGPVQVQWRSEDF